VVHLGEMATAFEDRDAKLLVLECGGAPAAVPR